jgi:SAM-dependent methyltransferase
VTVPGSLIYHDAFVYELAMLGLYGRHHGARYRAVACLIPDRSSVIDLCCGPGILFDRYLRHRSIDYTGIDINPRFVARVNRRGGGGVLDDLGAGGPLPEGDTVVMQAGLYQFLPDPGPIVRRMLQAARERVIIAEPVLNLTASSNRWLGAVARRLTGPEPRVNPARYTEASFDAFLASLGVRVTRSFHVPGGREKVVILDPHRTPPG